MFAVMSDMFGMGRGATDHDYVTGTLLEKRDFFVLLNLFYLLFSYSFGFFINKDDRPGVGYVARGYVGTGIRLRNSSASSETTPAFLQYKDA